MASGVTAAQLVQTLLGSGVQASNIQYTGAAVAAGRFSGGQATVGFSDGIVLGTGQVQDVIGTNPGTFPTESTSNGTPGDTQLNAIVTPNPTNDAAVLEFDFVPAGSVLTFNYVFSSEEYPDYVNSAYNDVFAFFLNGVNVALIPNTTTPVSINNVNASLNAQYFFNNYTNPTRAITMNGLTTVLTITANVNAGQTNHIKLAIADAGDSSLDSNVFIQSGSFSSPTPAAPKIRVYNPVRFAYNKVTKTYDGSFSLVNSGKGQQDAPVYIIFKNLPQGVTLQNGSGVTAAGDPYITLNKPIGAGKMVKLLVKLNNPLLKGLNSFYIGSNLEFTLTKPT